jgi:7-cyano-7-deazaguanine synthase in queuosine biosynthesis
VIVTPSTTTPTRNQVFTVTANSLAQSVQLVQGTRSLPMPDPSGQLVTRPVTRVDYAAYNPPG